MKLLYFSWVREKVGESQEDVPLPGGVEDVAGLVAWLKGRGDGYAEAFADSGMVRAAVNQEHVPLDHKIGDGDEIAFFPPVTGG